MKNLLSKCFFISLILFASACNCNNNEKKSKLLFIGDSITYGHNGYDFYWSRFFQDYEIINLSIPGCGADSLRWNIYNVIEANPDIISLMIGINDLGYNRIEKNEYLNYIKAFISSVKYNNDNCKIYVNSILPLGKESTYLTKTSNLEIRDWNTSLKTLIESDFTDVTFIDLYSDFYGRDELYLDGLHPNDKGYEIWIKKLKFYF